MPYRNVVIPVDGSEDSGQACKVAAQLLRLLPGEKNVHLVYCHPFVSGLVAGRQRGEVDEKVRQLAKPYFAYAREHLQGVDAHIHAHLLQGSPGKTIADAAIEHGCALIVMGTRGAGELSSLVLGSVSHDVLRHSEVPVLLAKYAGDDSSNCFFSPESRED